MEQQLKQRLVGVAVIFSLAVIFLPMLLDGSGTTQKPVQISIPAPPQVSSFEPIEERIIELKKETDRIVELEPKVVDQISDPPSIDSTHEKAIATTEKALEISSKAGQQADTPGVAAKTTAPKALAKPEPKKPVQNKPAVSTGGNSFVIQAGSFSDKNKAYKQRDRLRKSKLASVFIEKFKHDGVLSYRVRMGPFITRKKANIINNKLSAKYNIKGLVMRYEK